MQVHLAGHNLDRDLLMEIRAALESLALGAEGPEDDLRRHEVARLVRMVLDRRMGDLTLLLEHVEVGVETVIAPFVVHSDAP